MQKELTKYKAWAVKNGYQQSEISLLWYFNRKGKARKVKTTEKQNYSYEVLVNKKWINIKEVIKDGKSI
jgi:hypothetical protein